jgi:hypothetical protein
MWVDHINADSDSLQFCAGVEKIVGPFERGSLPEQEAPLPKQFAWTVSSLFPPEQFAWTVSSLFPPEQFAWTVSSLFGQWALFGPSLTTPALWTYKRWKKKKKIGITNFPKPFLIFHMLFMIQKSNGGYFQNVCF